MANRRHVLMSLFSLCSSPGAIAAVKPTRRVWAYRPHPIPAKFPGQPRFWFGDIVRNSWICDDDNKMHWEEGEVMGVIWDQNNKQWAYAINWVLSDQPECSHCYPCFDEHFDSGSDIELVVAS